MAETEMETEEIAVEVVDGEPILNVGGTRVRLYTELRIESDDNFLGKLIGLEAEVQTDDKDRSWWNLWPGGGEMNPRILLKPEVVEREK